METKSEMRNRRAEQVKKGREVILHAILKLKEKGYDNKSIGEILNLSEAQVQSRIEKGEAGS